MKGIFGNLSALTSPRIKLLSERKRTEGDSELIMLSANSRRESSFFTSSFASAVKWSGLVMN